MAVNRFTKYTPREFVQTYDPYPADKMMGLAQHQQRRFDQIDTAIGKAYADAVIKPGLSVEGRRTAAAVNKERKEQLDNVVNNFAEDRNVRNAVRGLSELSSNWQNDTRADFVNADRELMKPILNQTGQEGYGDYYTHKSYNPTTGEHTLGYTDEQIAAGVAPTMADYGAMSNPGSSVAFKTFIDPVKDVITQGMTQDPQGNWITRDGKYLDAQQFLDKAGADINKLSSDGWNIDQPSDADPQTQKFIKWRQKEFAEKGKVYTLPDFKDDFLTEAEKYTHNSNKTKITKGKSLKDGINSSTTPTFAPGVQTTSPNRNAILSQEYHEGGLDAYMKDLGYSDTDKFLSSIANPNNPAAKSEQLKLITEKVNKDYEGKYFNAKGEPIGSNRFDKGDGTIVPIESQADIEKRKNERINQLSNGLNKAFYFRQQAINDLSPSERDKIIFNSDGSYELTPEAKDEAAKKLEDAFKIDGVALTTENIANYFNDASSGYKLIEQVGKNLGIGLTDDDKATALWVASNWIQKGARKTSELMEGISNSVMAFSNDPIAKMEQNMNSEIKEHYGNRTYANSMIFLEDKEAIDITTQVNPKHQLLSAIATKKATTGLAFAVAGKEIGRGDLEDVDNMVEKGIEFRDGKFDPTYIEFDFVGKGKNMKVYATGNMTKKIESGENKGFHTSGKQYQVDITEEFFNTMGNNETSQLLYQDAILDAAYDIVPNGQEKQSVYLNTKLQDEADEFFGGESAMISKYVDPNSGQKLYNITGKVAMFDDNDQIKIVDAETYKEDGENVFQGLTQEQMMMTSREIAATLPYLTQSTTGATMTPAEQNAVKNLGIEYSDVESFDVGAFGLNTQSNASAAKQVQIGFASTAEAIESPVDQLSPKDQIDYSSHLFVNGGSGWNEWDVTKKNSSGTFENATFNKALRVLKGVPENPGSIIEALNTNAKTLELSEVNSTMITNIMSEFKGNVLQRKSNDGGYSPSDIAKNNNMSDSMVAIAVAIAQSGLNSNAIDVNQK